MYPLPITLLLASGGSKDDLTEQAGRDQIQAPLSLRADPVAGALIGTFLLAACLAGPVGLMLVLGVWMVIEAVRWSRVPRRGKRRGSGWSSQGNPTDNAFAARFRELENSILGADTPEIEAKKLAKDSPGRSQ